MKISLISIQQQANYLPPAEELALASLASYLRCKGHEVLESVTNSNDISIQEIINFRPSLIGFTAYNEDKDDIIIISEAIKREMPWVIICTGGTMPTYYFAEFLQEAKHIDFVIIGEGEITLLEVVSNIEDNSFEKNRDSIDGIAYLHNGIIHKTGARKQLVDMDSLPYPSRDILVKYKHKFASMSGSRRLLNGYNGWNSRKITSIVDEIEYIMKNHNIFSYVIYDTSFEDTGNNRLMDFAKEIINRGIDISYHIKLQSETCKKFTRKDVEILAKSGLSGVLLEIESGNAEDLKLYGKTATIEDNIEAIRLLNDCKIVVNAGFTNINPYSTVDGLLKNIAFLHEHLEIVLIGRLNTRLKLFRGMGLYNLIVKEGFCGEVFSGDDYQFITKNMDKFVEYMGKIENKLLTSPDFPKMLSFFYRYPIIIENLRRRIYDPLVLGQINFMKQTLKRSFEDINNMIVAWYIKLVNIIDNWDDIHAGKITEKYFNHNLIKAHIHNTEIAINKLIQVLATNSKQGLFIFQNYL